MDRREGWAAWQVAILLTSPLLDSNWSSQVSSGPAGRCKSTRGQHTLGRRDYSFFLLLNGPRVRDRWKNRKVLRRSD